MRKTSDLEAEDDVVLVACAYAVGFMFGKYDPATEIVPEPSPRAVKATKNCVEKVEQGH